jgi:hypothetical protein
MYAFALIHFGDNPKYLELELYTIIMLKKNTKYNIIYLYSINDTPKYFVKIMEKYCDKIFSFDDKGITYDIKNFKSFYKHFNTLRTCNFLYAYKLIEYKKICIIESDMIIMKNIDDIFDLNTPSIITYYDINRILENYEIKTDIKKELEKCSIKSNVNGGVILISPSIEKYKLCLKNINIIIKNNCIYPNETLFLICNNIIYNLPLKYNIVNFKLYIYEKKFKLNMKDYLCILHMNAKEYKHIDIIRDNFLNKLINKNKYKNYKYENNKLLYYFISYFKKNYYDKMNKNIKNICYNNITST